MPVDPDPAEMIGFESREQVHPRRSMQIRILGPFEVSVGDQPLTIGGAKQRAVLAMLGLEANRAVTADRLIAGLWGEEPPASAAKMVQNYVWRLRGVLDGNGGAEIVTRGRAYELRIDRELVDVCRLERLVAEAARAAAAKRPVSAAREALALFRGDPLSDVADEPFAVAEIRRLEELRLTAAELAIAADLDAGRHLELVGEIDALLARHPLRERLHAQRMLTLYRCGRQAEALEAYRHARSTLVGEIGVEPSAELRALQDAILRQDPSLDVEPAVDELPRALDSALAPPLVGRDDALRRLRSCWFRAAGGTGALVTVVGAYGIGKTRLAAELAGEVHREGAIVLHAAGTGAPEAVLAVLARAREARHRTLIVIDDADRTPADVRIAMRELGPALARVPVLVLACGLQAAALARVEPRESIVLEPLDAAGVRAIAGSYAPRGHDDAVPVGRLLAASGGVPRRVHEAAGEWARGEATRRVDAVADRTATGRAEARELEAELASSVVELQSARERADSAGRAADDGRAPMTCPYKGLATFDAADAEYFFGRERLVAELVARLVGAPLLAIVGPSGSGKSSVMRAGLLPALAGGVLPGSENWTVAVLRPGAQPRRELRRATRRLAREWHGVLAIDQFEELFTACEDEAERAEFVASLVRAARAGTVVVIAIRADFYGRCAAYPELSELLGANHVLVGAMSREELGRAIERPAQRAGLSVEDELVEALVADVEGRPGALPLLSTALLELWRDRDGRRLRLAAYARRGGVQGAVARLAEDVFVGLDPERQMLARALLVRLADEDEGGAVVRRRLLLDELSGGLTDVIAQLADRRLLTISDGAVEVAHEALLREWPRLRAWLAEDAEGRRLRRGLGGAARAWEADGRDPGGLYRGARLTDALDWAKAHPGELDPGERTFLDASRSASGRAQRRLRIMLAGAAALLVLAVIAGAVALDQRGDARAEATTAAAQSLGAQALADAELDRGLLLARQGVALDDSARTRGNLLATLLKRPAAIGVIGGHGAPVASLDLSPDGRTLAVLDRDGALDRIDAGTRRRRAPRRLVPGFPAGRGLVDAVRFSGDGSLLAIAGSPALVIDAGTGRSVASLPLAELRSILSARFAADQRSIIATIDSPAAGSTAIQRFDARTGRPIGRPRAVAPDGRSVTVLAGPGSNQVTTTHDGGPTVVRDAVTLRPLRRIRPGGEVAALSTDAHTMVTGGRDGAVRFVDIRTGTARTALGRHDGGVVRVALSRDGRTAVTAGADNRLLVWDVERGAVRETFQGAAQTTGLAISPDGRTLYAGGLDGKVTIWDLAGDRRLGRVFGAESYPRRTSGSDLPVSHALSADGRLLALGRRDGTVELVDPKTLRTLRRVPGVPHGAVSGLAFAPGSGLLAVAGGKGYLALIDHRDGSVVRPLAGHRDRRVLAPSFSTDGRRMLTVSLFDTVQLWTLRAGRPVGAPRRFPTPPGVVAAALSPDGRTVALTGSSGIVIADAVTMRRRATLRGSETVRRLVRFTADGRFIVGGSAKGWTRLWSARTYQPASPVLGGHSADVVAASTSPDGRVLATGSADGTVRLYDLRTYRMIGAPLPAVANRAVFPDFTSDGAYLFALTGAGRQYRWDVRLPTWVRQACAIAGRRLTPAEWREALPGREYRPACAARAGSAP